MEGVNIIKLKKFVNFFLCAFNLMYVIFETI
jgi:hypothetical protein